jgi:hypothetical protein
VTNPPSFNVGFSNDEFVIEMPAGVVLGLVMFPKLSY